MAHPSGESPRPLLACLFLVLAASFCDGYAPLLAQNPLNKAVRRSIHAPRATGVFTIPAGPFAPPLGAKGKPGRRGADLVHMSVLEDIGDPAQLKDNAAILLEACGLERADAVRFVDCCNEAGSTKKGGDLLVEGKDVQEKRSIYLLLNGQVSMDIGGKNVPNMVRGNFLGSARFMEEETLRALSEMRDTPLTVAFAKADSDNSGTVDVDEVLGALSSLGIDATEEQAKTIMQMVDMDNDGAMSLSEVKTAAGRLRSNAKMLFRNADRDGSASLEEPEVKMLLQIAGMKVTDDQMKQFMALLRRILPRMTLSATLEKVDQITSGTEMLKTRFESIDKDSNGQISRSEFEELLEVLNIKLPSGQSEVLFNSVDLNGDGSIDYLEFETSLDRVKERTIARFGNTLRLYETVAYNTMKRKQITYRSSTSSVQYLRWDYDTVVDFFQRYPDVAVKIRDLWAVQGARRAIQRQSAGKKDQKHAVGDYGYGGEFTYGKRGDYGPLEKAVPGNIQKTSVWHFGREYAAMRRALKIGEFKEFVDAVSGARAWERVREGLRRLGDEGSDDGRGLKDGVEAMFKSMDKDESGSLSAREIFEGLCSVGVTVSEEEVGRMVKAADKDGDGISLMELQAMINDVADGKAAMKAALKQGGAWLPSFVATPILWILEFLRTSVGGADDKVGTVVRPYGDNYPEVQPEVAKLRSKLGELKLENDAVWKREENRRDQIMSVLERAKVEDRNDSGRDSQLVRQLETTKSPAIIFGPYLFLCWLLDVLFTNRPIQRFWFLETVARMPYFSYITMLTLYESLGWWRTSSDVRRIHFAEEWNEVQHLKIMESLGGDRLWIDRFLARHAAIFYYVILNHVWLISPSFAYNFSELIEFHAVDTYGEFVDANEELLKSMPPPQEAVDYYMSGDMFLFDEFQTGREVSSRRPKIDNLYDVFCSIRDDELEHVKTMFQCQTAEVQIVSPNTRKAPGEEPVHVGAGDGPEHF